MRWGGGEGGEKEYGESGVIRREEEAFWFSRWVSLTCGTPESWLRVAKETRGSHDNVPPETQLSRSEPQPRSWLNCLPMNPWATSEYFMFSSIRFGECAECLLSRARPGGCELEPDSARPLTAQPGCERRFGV